MGLNIEEMISQRGTGISMNPNPANLKKLAREVRDFKFFMSISQWPGDMPGWKEPSNENSLNLFSVFDRVLKKISNLFTEIVFFFPVFEGKNLIHGCL